MPSRHSKNTGSRPHFTYHEKAKAAGSITQRIGGESQLPFGYCALSLTPSENTVVSPSGRLYSREFILEYILTKTQELKKQWSDYEAQQVRFMCALYGLANCTNMMYLTSFKRERSKGRRSRK
jgi:nitric oxide synthase-interacting protein